jgi:hypothetical protein
VVNCSFTFHNFVRAVKKDFHQPQQALARKR